MKTYETGLSFANVSYDWLHGLQNK